MIRFAQTRSAEQKDCHTPGLVAPVRRSPVWERRALPG